MNINSIRIIAALLIPCSFLFADEIDDLKVEIQNLKEKMTVMNNRIPRINNETTGFSAGFPIGIYNEDYLYGIEFGYYFKNNLGVRADIHFLGDTDRGAYLIVALPSVGILGKSPLFYNFHTYGGFFAGASKELNGKKNGPYFHIRGFAGIEFVTTKNVAFFIEIGGGGILSDAAINYTRGSLLSGGSRIYF